MSFDPGSCASRGGYVNGRFRRTKATDYKSVYFLWRVSEGYIDQTNPNSPFIETLPERRTHPDSAAGGLEIICARPPPEHVKDAVFTGIFAGND
jgi:hypothetical protein